MFKFVLLIAVLIAGAACDSPCTKCFTDLGPFQCSMLQEVKACLANEANCKYIGYEIEDGCEFGYVMAYYAYQGSGINVYNSFMRIGDLSHLHDLFYSSELMDVWEYLPIDQVFIDLYEEEGPSRSLSFDGRNTTRTNWFSSERLLDSPWDDLTKDNSYYFSLEGFAGVKRFYIAKEHSECGSEYGWLSIVEGEGLCDYTKADSYPKIMFSGLAGATLWNEQYKEAAVIDIWIKLIQ